MAPPHPLPHPRSARRRAAFLFAANVAAVLAVAAVAAWWLLAPSWGLLEEVGERRPSAPSRIYGQPPVLRTGAPLVLAELVRQLEAQGYRASLGSTPPPSGRFQVRAGGHIRIGVRGSPSPQGPLPPRLVEVQLQSGRIAELQVDGRSASAAALEPPLLAAVYGPRRLERRPVTLADLNNDLVRAVLAAEDDGFFQHGGLSLSGVLRALWVDLSGGEIRQGGSTVTQQLARNLFLSQERTIARKVREAALAVALELELSKWEILESYLNVVYLGVRDGVSIIGVGAGARAYFGKDARELSLAEAAALAGMIAAPGQFSPLVNPERCRQRRDHVLRRLAELGWAEGERVRSALAESLEGAPEPLAPRHAPYFVDLVRREVAQGWTINALEDGGFTVLTTLSLPDQMSAASALTGGLAALERGRPRRSEPLQGALVSLEPRTGAILAYVGGRDWAASQFDRVGQARRPPGSAFKPVVYAAAFARGVLTPASRLDDAPLSLDVGGTSWTPQNDDGRFEGSISVRRAVEESRNVPAVRAALAVGLEEVAALARRMGVISPLEPIPSLALGAFALSPLELATVYGTLAAGGMRPRTHGVTAVLDSAGAPLPRSAPPLATVSALSPEVTFLVTSTLEGVIARGTGRGVRSAGLEDPLAGKTGTSNDRRDAWFAGYAAERVTVVWVGYDSNAPTRLSGASGALPIWSQFTLAVRPPGGYGQLARPTGVVKVLIDPASGGLATSRCPLTIEEYFLAGYAPTGLCPLHDHGRAHALPQDELPTPSRRFLAGRPRPRR